MIKKLYIKAIEIKFEKFIKKIKNSVSTQIENVSKKVNY